MWANKHTILCTRSVPSNFVVSTLLIRMNPCQMENTPIYTQQANPTPYSPYENEMQRAQAADRAQRFLSKINGGPSGRKNESEGQLLPVKDHRPPKARGKLPRKSRTHVCSHTLPLCGEKGNIFAYSCHAVHRGAVYTL